MNSFLAKKIEFLGLLIILLFCSMGALFSQESKELYVLDRAFKQYEIIRYNLDPEADVLILGETEDYLEELTEYLKKCSGLSSMHLFVNGKEGMIDFNRTKLKSENLHQFITVFNEWKTSFTEEADLMIYTSSFAEDNQGKGVIRRLSAYTGLDVAASVDQTGCGVMEKDWILEFKKGIVETRSCMEGIKNNQPEIYQAMK